MKGSDAARLVCIKCNAMHSRDGVLQQREAVCMLFVVHCQLSRDLPEQSPWLIDLPNQYGQTCAQELLGWLSLELTPLAAALLVMSSSIRHVNLSD